MASHHQASHDRDDTPKGGWRMEFQAIPAEVEHIGKDVVDAAFAVHSALGPGLLETVYELCLAQELIDRGRKVERQVPVPIVYKGNVFSQGFRIDVLVDKTVVCELKAVEELHPRTTAQLLTYMRLTKLRLGYILNFGGAVMKSGIKRIVV